MNNKQGFTMAELLLSFAIIGIVSAMGMTLTKQSMEKAYRTYWQTGYNNLLSVISETDLSSNQTNNLVEQCKKMFNGFDIENITQEIVKIKTKNGISYTFEKPDDSSQSILDNVVVTMTVPQPKTRKNKGGEASTQLLVIANGGFLVPLPAAAMSDDTKIDLSDSRLLQFYNDNGKDGRRTISGSKDEQLVPKTFKKAFCENEQFSGTGNEKYGKPENEKTLDEWFNCTSPCHNEKVVLLPVLK